MAFSKILIANRGEITLRVIRTAKALGYQTVAVYSEADADALHVKAADQAVCIGPAPVNQSYLSIDAIIKAAKLTGADAVHPGYGFLSENEDFARACQEAGITFIGPDADSIELMGNKRAAKIAVMKNDVPVVPGYQGADQSDATLIAESKKIGFPIMVKAAAGGGGRGMRLVTQEADLAQAIQSARSEATNAFGSGELILEKAIVGGRHVEIQIFGDRQGNVIHLGERDCSVQRRHQKIIEESPSPAVDAVLRKKMGGAAVNAGRSCNYVGAGTVEFILGADGEFYFLEMNTRLQVEHPVTEMVTGLDLVALQLRVAAGEPLPLKQEDVSFNGHAIEVRLYAEDPAQNFLPQTGTVCRWNVPEGMDVRVDHCVFDGLVVGTNYDPMLAKVIVHGATRDEARRRLVAALDRTTLLGLNTNKKYLCDILNHKVFADGGATTAFIGDHMGQIVPAEPAARTWALAAMARYLASGTAVTVDPRWIGWRSGSDVPSCLRLECGEKRKFVTVTAAGRGKFGSKFAIAVSELKGQFPVGSPENVELEALSATGGEFVFILNGVREKVVFTTDEATVYLDVEHGNRAVRDVTIEPPVKAGAAGSGQLKAPMDGNVVNVVASEGEAVVKGQLIGVIEAMKMEHSIKADVDGIIKSIKMQKGQQVKVRQLLVEITPAVPAEAK
jgi:geranyl-CoA carboxylase alpha subunit